jgi:hypothetical protein
VDQQWQRREKGLLILLRKGSPGLQAEEQLGHPQKESLVRCEKVVPALLMVMLLWLDMSQ